MMDRILGKIGTFFKEGIEGAGAREAFEDFDLQLRIRRLKIGSLMIVVMEPLGTNLDHTLYPDQAPLFLELRVTCALLAAGVLALAYSPWVKGIHRPLGLVLPLLPNFFTAWMIYATQGSLSPYYAGITQVLMAVALVMPWTAWETALVSLLSTFFYYGACRMNGPLDGTGVFSNNLTFLIYTEIIVVIGSYLTYQWRARQFALSFELDRNRRLLEDSNRKLVDLDRMKSRFFANISHELRTPLTLLISPLEALEREKGPSLDKTGREILASMKVNAMRLLKLINDLLDLVKLESGKMEVRKEPVELGAFLRGLLHSAEGPAKDKRIELSAAIPEGLGTFALDRDKLEKIVLNLVFNSVKFTPSGGRVEVGAQEEEGSLVLWVKDNGMGISEENLPFIFDRFWQADSSARRRYQGTGIGLALVKELAEAQGGTVGAESRPGQGTTMTLRLPAEKAVEVRLPAAPDKPRPESDEWLQKLYRRAELFPALAPLPSPVLPGEDLPRGRNPKVLVADDEPDLLRFLRTQLERDYEVLEAVDGSQAVEKARQFLPDLILLDMMMPEKDGIEACRELKGYPSTQAIPVVLLTARADDETKMAALGAGASDFLSKPFSTTELHLRVRNLVEAHGLQRDLARQKSALESTLEQLKETEGQLVQNEKMASLGRLSAGIIHEINNPLNYAVSAIHVLKTKKESFPPGERERVGEILFDLEEGVGRVQRIVSDLRTFTHPGGDKGLEMVPVEEAVSSALRFLSHEWKEKVEVQRDIPPGQRVLANKHKLIHILVNLFQNSLDAMEEKGLSGFSPRLKVSSLTEGVRVLLSVRDNGKGIAPGDLDKVFDPFFTTKEPGKGMGLGLSLCFRMMREQGGDIRVRSVPGEYTEFTLELGAVERA